MGVPPSPCGYGAASLDSRQPGAYHDWQMRAWNLSTALISAVVATLLAAMGVVLTLEARQAPANSVAPPGAISAFPHRSAPRAR